MDSVGLPAYGLQCIFAAMNPPNQEHLRTARTKSVRLVASLVGMIALAFFSSGRDGLTGVLALLGGSRASS